MGREATVAEKATARGADWGTFAARRSSSADGEGSPSPRFVSALQSYPRRPSRTPIHQRLSLCGVSLVSGHADARSLFSLPPRAQPPLAPSEGESDSGYRNLAEYDRRARRRAGGV